MVTSLWLLFQRQRITNQSQKHVISDISTIACWSKTVKRCSQLSTFTRIQCSFQLAAISPGSTISSNDCITWKIDWQNFTFILYMSVFRCFILKQFHACPELEEMHPCKNKWGLWKPFAPTFQLVQLTNHGNVGFESPIDSATSLAVKLSACA